MTTPSDTRHYRIAEAFRAQFPHLNETAYDRGGWLDHADQYATVAVEAIEPIPAGRCIRALRPHRWTRWRVINMPLRQGSLLSVAGVQKQQQQRECARCGRIQRTDLTP